MKTIVFNSSGMAMYEVGWQKAVTLYYKGKVDILATYDVMIHSPTMQMLIPRWIRLKDFDFSPKSRRVIPLSRKSLLNRDHGKCGYCRCDVSIKTMTMDHIIPKSRGGKSGWENIVSSCSSCNRKKGDKTPEEANMPLRTRIYIPRLEDTWLHVDIDYNELMSSYSNA